LICRHCITGVLTSAAAGGGGDVVVMVTLTTDKYMQQIDHEYCM